MPFLEDVNLPCPQYNNPADYSKLLIYFTNLKSNICVLVIELISGDEEKNDTATIDILAKATDNGKTLTWMENVEDYVNIDKLKGFQS